MGWHKIKTMKPKSCQAAGGEKKERLEARLKRIESDIAMLKEKLGIRD